MVDSFGIFSIANVLCCIGAFCGIGLWHSSNDQSSAYGFYWFMAIGVCIFGIAGIIFSQVLEDIDKNVRNVVLTGITLIGSICWLATFASVAKLCSDCVYFPDSSYVSCHGEIVSTTFSGLLFMLWGAYFICNCVKVHKSTQVPPTRSYM